MAAFPALYPVSRSFGLPVYQVTVESGFSGGEARFLHSTWSSGHRLSLRFEGLTASELQLIRDHYRGQEGGMRAFSLSPEVWAGNTDITRDIGPWPVLWRYAEPITEESPRGGIGDVVVSLESVI